MAKATEKAKAKEKADDPVTAAGQPLALVLERVLDAPREAVYRCWTDAELMKQWFVPKPWSIAKVEIDLRPGGKSLVVMRNPEGQEFPNAGIYLAVEPGRRLVFTDAFVDAWTPSSKAFMVAEVSFGDAPGGKTAYKAVARHWNEADRKQHEDMGFHEGWGKCAEQLEALAKTL
jgi:uncharacterized protein YndB with AHSA1/START domain